MLTGVAKKMAGQFFAAVDADIVGVRSPLASAHGPGVELGAPALQGTYAGSATRAGRAIHGRDLLLGALAGAAIALAGVVVGIRAARR
jgi:hypothetical protein